MNKNLTFSIVVPFFNESQKLPSVIKALIELEWPANDYEVILVDNMSSDDSAAIAKSCMSEFPNGRVISCTDFRSSYAARNVGWRNSNGQYIVFIDADCIADKDLLSGYDRAIQMDTANEIGIFAGTIEPYNRDKLTPVEKYSSDKKLLNQDSAVKGWAYRPFAQTANAAFPKKTLEAVNGFNPHMTSGGDGELCWRIMDETGKRITHCKDAKVLHWHRESLRDLFSQFEKYGIGRFQQSAVIQDFDKGLIGVTKNTIVESLESLEKEILSKIQEPYREETLWKLYDIVSKAGNSIGYLGAKGLITSKNDEKNIFSKPEFKNVCIICKSPNPEKLPTLAKHQAHQAHQAHETRCINCGSSLIDRLATYISDEAPPSAIEKNAITVKLSERHIKSPPQETIITITNPESIGQCITAIRWAIQEEKTLLIIFTQEQNHENKIKEIYNKINIGNRGHFHDSYSDKSYFFILIN